MKKILFLILIVLFFVQYSYISLVSGNPYFRGSGLIATFIIALFLKENVHGSFWWAFLVGLLLDYFSTTSFGTYAIIFIILAGIIKIYKAKFEQSRHKMLFAFTNMFLGLILIDIFLLVMLKMDILLGIPRENIFVSDINIEWYFISKVFFALLGVGVFILLDKALRSFDLDARRLKIENI
ncbi:MAG: hypothetical protein U9M90_03175 [Patescibacteria group bacterium]|nr:hypothetical protein [Patescibacteria group bacterium]